jgi:hypothetical protein
MQTIRLEVSVPTDHDAQNDSYQYAGWEIDLCLDCCRAPLPLLDLLSDACSDFPAELPVSP